ncbi:MAG: hypothetical protein KKB08_06735 [Gammaproteobacteria bacterium]|nr:hypothetical protein [Gammaproteobacteria bacterium]MBU1816437.1 hypothetical protein [Gammaproteobacteria bacterium]
MAVIAPTPVDALPTAPDPNDRATFDARAYPYQVALSGAYRTQINAIADNVNNNAGEAVSAATAAAGAAASAADVQAVVLGAANFKGLWSSLTGPLSKPATVKDGGRFWLLLDDLADVTAAVPGVSASWTALDTGIAPTQYITSNTTVVPGVRYIVGASGITLNMTGVTWAKGDYFGVREAIGTGTYTINFGTTKDRTQTRGSVLLDAGFRQLDRNYEDATRGLI